MNPIRMPALFLGHGSPMNVLEENRYTRCWRQLGEELPRPAGIIAISAHWDMPEIAVTAMKQPRTIHDFGAFPSALFATRYPAPGSPALAAAIAETLAPLPVRQDRQWGLDHGTWGVLIKMYPAADIPVVQLSINSRQSPAWHLALGRRLARLREQGYMIIASGNVVHNLSQLRRQDDAPAWPWATAFNQYVTERLDWQGSDADHPLLPFMQHPDAVLANPTPEHILPLFCVLGTRCEDEPVTIPVNGIVMGAISMLSVMVGGVSCETRADKIATDPA